MIGNATGAAYWLELPNSTHLSVTFSQLPSPLLVPQGFDPRAGLRVNAPAPLAVPTRTNAPTVLAVEAVLRADMRWWGRRELNPHGLLHKFLRLARLPFRHVPWLGRYCSIALRRMQPPWQQMYSLRDWAAWLDARPTWCDHRRQPGRLGSGLYNRRLAVDVITLIPAAGTNPYSGATISVVRSGDGSLFWSCQSDDKQVVFHQVGKASTLVALPFTPSGRGQLSVLDGALYLVTWNEHAEGGYPAGAYLIGPIEGYAP